MQYTFTEVYLKSWGILNSIQIRDSVVRSGVEKKYLAGLITPSHRCNSGPRNMFKEKSSYARFFFCGTK